MPYISGKTPGKRKVSGKRLKGAIESRVIVKRRQHGQLLHDASWAPPAHPEEAPQRRLGRPPVLAYAVPGRGPPADELAGPRIQVCMELLTRYFA